MTVDERAAIAKAAQDAMLTIEEIVRAYAAKAGAPARFAVGVYDATGTGENYAAGGSVADRAIAEFKISEADWGERNYLNTARGKVGVSLRTGETAGM